MDGVTLLVRGRRRKFILDQVRSGARKSKGNLRIVLLHVKVVVLTKAGGY